ncbi:YL1 nuclear protein [Leishmania donovani]|uniref:YL1_nuclear_protein_putative/Pfam:PF05764 n=1 Tax=Leishmania donovani TaxID=5661 RepID=A0A6J8FCS0_LEIDO|nr:YL1 nuclear protein [Leishmania donovani]VDZ45069.1 YL1_nuclear_protein_putative/Pfam:PF05764 [Leishmania donovani]
MEWADDVVNRPRRANAGNRLQELLANGLDEEEEKALQALSDASSDTSFTLGSDEETVDEVESDFDAEEVGGTLEGEDVETEASVRRAERQERQLERRKKLQRSQNFSKVAARDRAQRLESTKRQEKRQRGTDDAERVPRQRQPRKDEAVAENDDEDGEEEDDEDGSDDVIDLRQRVRHRPVPTIPCSQRLAEAYARAAALRAAQAAAEAPRDGNAEGASFSGGAGVVYTHRGLNMLKARQRARRPQHSSNSTMPRSAWEAREALPAPVEGTISEPIPVCVSPRIALYEGIPQRVGYSSGASVLQRFRVPTVVSFSAALPPVLQP